MTGAGGLITDQERLTESEHKILDTGIEEEEEKEG